MMDAVIIRGVTVQMYSTCRQGQVITEVHCLSAALLQKRRIITHKLRLHNRYTYMYISIINCLNNKNGYVYFNHKSEV